MAADVAVRASNLGKSYTRYGSRWAMLMDRLAGSTRRGTPHWALRGASFEVRRGECFGVIGRNGAGKSTLLQLLAGVLQPTEGTLEVHGKVLALLELGASFDPESTGRENCKVQMALFGIPAAGMDAKLAAVEAFAEIGQAFGQPVKTYSSGMFVRLAFAVNTVLEPDVLLVDEALAVGDVFFQQKCHTRLRELQARGTTVVLVSHDLALIEQRCDRALCLEQGRPAELGPAYGVVHRFRELAVGRAALAPPSDAVAVQAGASLARLAVLDGTGAPRARFLQGEVAVCEAEFLLERAIGTPVAGVEVHDATARNVHARHTLQFDCPLPEGVAAGSRVLLRQQVRLDLEPGRYTVAFGLASASPGTYATRHLGWGGGDLEMLLRTRPVAEVEVALPEEMRPARPAFHGGVRLDGGLLLRVTGPDGRVSEHAAPLEGQGLRQ